MHSNPIATLRPPGSPIRPGRRGDSRVRLRIPARLILLTETQPCVLEDLSASGAALIAEGRPPAIGTAAVLQCQGIEAFGTVRWSRHGRCGLLFEERLPLEDVVAMRHVADTFEADEQARFRESARLWVQGGKRSV